jgi:hypothetical protein
LFGGKTIVQEYQEQVRELQTENDAKQLQIVSLQTDFEAINR